MFFLTQQADMTCIRMISANLSHLDPWWRAALVCELARDLNDECDDALAQRSLLLLTSAVALRDRIERTEYKI